MRRLLALQAIQSLVGLLKRRKARFLLDRLDLARGLLETVQGLLRKGLVLGQCDGNFSQPAELAAVTGDLGNDSILNNRVAGLVDGHRRREPGCRNALTDIAGERQAEHPKWIKAKEICRHARLLFLRGHSPAHPLTRH